MKRLLCIVTNMNTGGAETFLMKVYRQLDRKHYQMDFCICNPQKNFYEAEIEKLGGRIYHLPLKSKHPLRFLYEFCKLLRTQHYTYALRLGSTIFEMGDLCLCGLLGVKARVFRSCNANASYAKPFIWAHKLLRGIVMKVANIKIAPSDLAAQFTFGNAKDVHLLPNGLDTQAFAFSGEKRQKIRQELNAQDKFVVGPIGRFNFQKNHSFLLGIFAEIKKRQSNAVLWLIGKGELEEQIKQQAKSLGLEESVVFLGVRADIPALLAAMDAFVFPSLFEGMPNTAIEAQTSGLPCLIADTITKQAKQTDIVHFRPLTQSPEKWAQKVLEIAAEQTLDKRAQAAAQMRAAGYDISKIGQQFATLVFGESDA